jgi:glycolate oxidase FAD binding subunit
MLLDALKSRRRCPPLETLMSSDAADILAELTVLAPGAAVDGKPQINVAGVVPTAQVRPSTVRDLEQIVGWASRRGLALAAVGGRTKLGVGNPPSRLDVVLDMTGLDAIIEYDPEDLVLTAQAGATIQKVQSVVNQDSLVLPLDPLSPDRATLGGVIACADLGPRRRQYGGVRDIVLGLKAVLPDGSLVSFGGRTLKNVAGYDVGKVLVGSLGTIGVIAEVSVRLLPLPASEELLLIGLPELDMGRRLVARILDSPLLPSSLELMSPACAALLPLDQPSSSLESSYLMFIAVEGHSADVERQVRDICVFCAELDPDSTTVHRASDIGLAPREGWAAFDDVRERALATGSGAGFRCSMPLAPLWDVARAVEEHSRGNDIAASYRMSCGTGYLEAYAAGPAADLRAFAEGVRAEAEQQGGALSVLHGWSALGKDFDAWGTRRSDYDLMRAVKQKFDPEGIMNPGRFVGGL